MIAASRLPLPPLLELPALDASSPGNPTAAHTQWSGGRVNFENPNYLISAGEDSHVWVLNKGTEEQYLAWGPPQLWVDGAPAFSFSGNTSLALHDGTLLTLTTKPLAEDPLVTAIRKVTITQGNYGVEILGLNAQDDSALRFVETQRYGWLLDAAVGDGNVIYENDIGAGFVGNNLPTAEGPPVWMPVDQAYIDATDLARLGELAGTRGSAFVTLPTLMSITFGGIFRGPLAYRYSEWVDTPLNPNDADQEQSATQQWRLRVPRDAAGVWQVAARPLTA
jgi:hypothetical protein